METSNQANIRGSGESTVGSFCSATTGALRPPRPRARDCGSHHFFPMSPMSLDIVVLFVIHSLFPSPSGLLASLVPEREREWRDSDVLRLHRLSRRIASLGDLQTHTHTTDV